MVAMLCLVLAMLTVLAVVRTVARLMLAAVWGMALIAFLGWVAVSPDAGLFPAARWALAA